MKKLQQITLFTFSIFLLAACGTESPKEGETDATEKEVCFYSYNEGSTVMGWTAFKFNDKTPVKGTFKEINVEGTLESDDAMALLKSLSFDIPVSSIESLDEDRNAKIIKHFFGTIATENLTGKILSLGNNGEAVLEVSMNNMKKKLQGKYTFVDGKFDFSATMDVANWGAASGIEALNTICKDLHTGPDGISKLWSEVDLTFSTTLMSDCN